MPAAPVPYHPGLETPEEDEAETIAGLNAALAEIMETVAADEGRARRAVHAKGHGYLEATLTVPEGLPPHLAQGLFAQPGEHGAILRLSTNPGDLLQDSIALPRGAALKVLGVEGERLDGDGASQDFLMVNGEAFAASSLKQFLGNLKLLAKTTDRAEWAKVALSKVLRGAEAALETVGLQSATLQTLGGAPNVHPLGESFFTQTAFRHGDFVAKYSLVPVSPSLTRHTGEAIDASSDPDAIRHAVDADAQRAPMEWELRAQLLRDPATQSVEDPSQPWDEAASPWETVARLRAEPQSAWGEARSRAVDDGMRFSPWTALAAHRPLGRINRGRRATYDASAAFRGRFNACPVHEPATATLPA